MTTAPKDGSEILVSALLGLRGLRKRVRAHSVIRWQRCEFRSGYWEGGQVTSDWRGRVCDSWEATHWTPLPVKYNPYFQQQNFKLSDLRRRRRYKR